MTVRDYIKAVYNKLILMQKISQAELTVINFKISKYEMLNKLFRDKLAERLKNTTVMREAVYKANRI